MARYIKFPIKDKNNAIIDLAEVIALTRKKEYIEVDFKCGRCIHYHCENESQAKTVFEHIWNNMTLEHMFGSKEDK
ncbi:MAG: hypothetical protein IKY94_15475 [Lachnospiraceae bacterium]|nr:hypothetical protein [Lachnospiraceae bacterium]